MFHSKGDNCKESVADKVCKEVGTGWRLEVFCNCRALMKKLNRILFLLVVCVFGVKYREEFIQKWGIGLEVLDDVDLVEKYQRVEDGESRIIKNSSQNNIFQVLQSPCMSDFPQNNGVLYWNDFLISAPIIEVLAVIRLVSWEFRVIWKSQSRRGSILEDR